MTRSIALLILFAFLSACQPTTIDTDLLRSQVQTAVDNSARPEPDQKLDPLRNPVDVLTFFEIQPGMKVIDIFGGGGYYTEIVSYLVGDTGSVTLYNNNPWDNFVKTNVAARLEGNRLPNVNSLIVEPAKLGENTDRFDAAIFFLGMHDVYYEDTANGWPAIDVKKFLANIHKQLNNGGILGIIDHNAEAGSDPGVVGKSLHRIDPQIIIDDLEAIGFKYEGESSILRNPEDSLTESVFKPELRYKTDRSVLKFRK
jgi:predicted methyltransferase